MEILVHRDPDGNGRRVEVTVQSRRPSDRVGGGRGVCMRRAWVTTQEDEDEKCKWDTQSLLPWYQDTKVCVPYQRPHLGYIAGLVLHTNLVCL